jgi:MFS family permease
MTRAPSLLRNVSVLAACQALFFVANAVLISTAALVGLHLAPSPALATVPIGVQFVGALLLTMPASLLMARLGRRPGLVIGMTLGVLSGWLGFVAIMRGSFLLFCVSGALYGGFSAFCQYFRFTAADAADAACCAIATAGQEAQKLRARAIAWVMAGGIAAVASKEWFAPILFAGSYAAIALLAALAGLILLALDLPLAGGVRIAAGGRPTLEIVRDPKILVAFGAAVVAYVTMNLLMVATPLAMLACAHPFEDAATVIQWHIVGMFAPSFVTGPLIARLGTRPVIAAGAVIMLGCVAIHLSGVELGRFLAGLFLLGVGWNFMFVGATTLLTECYSPAEKARVQGLNDLVLFTTVAASATLSGFLHDAIGWQAMNLVVVPALLAVLAVLLIHRPAAAIHAAE